jgi:N-acetylglucosaminyl-diphospho-decaprenol L-rhamnosyltransferase
LSEGPDVVPSLEIVVVSFRSSDLLRLCLQSIDEHATSRGPQVVHVVDNASGDGTAEMVREEFPAVRLQALSENLGFSAANNLALRKARAPYVLVLNPDTELRAGVLDHLLEVMDASLDIGMCGCRLVQPDGTFDHAAKRSFPTPVSALAHFTGVGRKASGGALAQYRATELGETEKGDVDAINGAFMLVRRSAMQEVGLFDEGYWLYMEDLDWCARFWECGWRVYYDGTVTAIHVKGGTAGKHRAFRTNLHFHRGMGRFYRRHQAGSNLLLDAAVYAGVGAKFGVSALRSAWARLGS